MEFRDLKKQYAALKQDIDRAMTEVAASGAFIMGNPVRELEAELAEYVGVKHCLACADGTDALTLALKALGVGKGDAVFVPDFTFFASAEVVSLEGATPVFVDVDPRTFNMDAKSLDDAIRSVHDHMTLRPKAVIAVDLFGLPADFTAIRAITKREGMYLIEDGAQGFGGSIKLPKPDGDGFVVRRACSFGDISTTSFFPAKPLGCYGDGGAVFTDNDEWAALIESYRVHGKGSYKYDNVRIGLNSRLDTLQAAILRVKFKAFKEHELADVTRNAEYHPVERPLRQRHLQPRGAAGQTQSQGHPHHGLLPHPHERPDSLQRGAQLRPHPPCPHALQERALPAHAPLPHPRGNPHSGRAADL